MNEQTSNQKHSPSWLGPVAGAIILIGGYVGYQEWKERNIQTEMCARLKRVFQGNMEAMMGPTESAIAEAKKHKDLSSMGSLTEDVTANQMVMNQLNDNCPGWTTTQYD